MPLYAITYVYDTDRLEDLDRLRPAHRAHLTALHERGVNQASGPWTDGAPGALLLIHAASAQAALDAVAQDPFWVDGLVTRREVRGWNPAVGSLS